MTKISSTTIVVFVTSFLMGSESVKHSKYFSPDTYLSTPQIIRRNGYTAEAHIIETTDGYLLEYHRIPYAKNAKAATRGYPIILHHGVLSSSADWVTTGPGTSLPYQLADNGFDVWLANSRGNTYSKSHVKYSTTDRNFWNFSYFPRDWYVRRMYDTPAAIDYILNVTSAKKVVYIGHSMGTTIFYVFASTRPEYNEKVLFQISLAPVAAIPHATSILAAFVPYVKKIEKVVNYLQNGAFLEHNKLAYTFCKQYPNLCEQILFSVCGVDRQQLNASLLPLIASKGPGGTSTKTAVHLSQLVSTGQFRQFDYGKVENLKRYKSETPPPYKIGDIKIPMTFYYGRNDILANPKDVEKLYREVPRPMGLNMINYEKWNHIDFLWATEVKKYFMDPLLEVVINATTDPSFIEQSVERELAERAEERRASNNKVTSNETRDENNRPVTKPHHRIRRQLLTKGLKALMSYRNKTEHLTRE